MKTFGSSKDSFEFNEIEVEENNPPSDSPADGRMDDILKNLDSQPVEEESPTREKESRRPPTTPLYNIPIESLSRRERKRLMKLERKVQRRKLRYDYKIERERLKAELKSERRKYREKKEEEYHWFFFLCSTLIGLALAVATDGPTALFLGIGLGFLFFVDPVYQKVMQLIRDL